MRAAVGIESRTAFLAYAPTLPEGSLLYSILVLAHRVSGSPNRLNTMERVYGNRSASMVNLFGAGANHVAKSYLADTLSPDQVLRQHTLFGYYSLGLSESTEAEWATQLKTGSAKGPARYTRAFGPLAGVKGLRWCAECARIDQEQMGFASWRVIHQLPFVQACPAHGSPLYVNCQDCQSPLDTGRQYRLPGEHCGSCGSLRFTALAKIENPSYFTLISRCEQAICTQSDEFRPQAWARRVTEFVATHRSPHAAEQFLAEQICAKWGVQSPEDINDMLSYPLGKDYVAELLGGNTAKYSLVAQIITGDAMPVAPLENVRFSDPRVGAAQALSTVGGSVNSDALRNRVDEICTDFGVPSKFLDSYISGVSMSSTAESCGVSQRQIRRVLAHPEASRAIAVLRAETKQKQNIRTGALQVKGTPRPRLPSSASFEDRRASCRLRLLKLKIKLSTAARSDVLRKNGKLGTWLLRNDKDWLDENLPSQRPGRKRRQSSVDVEKK